MEKIIRLSIENTTKIRQVEDSFCELYSHDKNNGAFEFEISKGTLTNENVVALFKFLRSGSYWKTTGSVEGNKIKFNFDTSLITQNEEVVCYIYLDKEERNSDIFRFKFKVNLSEIDKASQLPTKERYFANSMIVDRVDVLTKEDFEKAIKEIEKGSKFLTESQANEKYALKEDIPNVSNFISSEHLSDYALKTEIPSTETIVNKAVEKVEEKGYLTEHQSLNGYVTETQLNEKGYLTKHQDISKLATQKAVDDVAAKVTQLENRPVTSSYDDSEIKRKLKELEDRPTTANIDTSNFVTNTQLENKHYLTEHQQLTDYVTKNELRNKNYLTEHLDISKLATKEQLDEVRNSQPTVDNLVTKEQLRKAFLNEEGQEKYASVKLGYGLIASYTGEKSIEDYFAEITEGLDEDAKTIYNGVIFKSNTDTKVYIKGTFVDYSMIMRTLAKIFPANYNYTDEDQVVNILTNKNYQDYIKGGNVDTSNFVTKIGAPYVPTGGVNVETYFNQRLETQNTNNFGKLYSDDFGKSLVISGRNKTTKFQTLLYTVANSIPNSYEPDFEFSESDNLRFITTQNIHDYIPSNNGGNTTELDKRLKVLEAKNWEIHGRGMPNGTVAAPVGTTYVDEAVTNGALKWIKKTGTGNTGWDVLIGDTGWKIIPSVSKLGGSYVKVRRVNNVVSYQFGGLSWGWFGIVRRGGTGYQVQPSDRERNCFILGLNGIPTGYRSESSLIGGIYNDKGIPYGTWYLGGVGDGNMLRFQFTDPVPTDRDIGDIRVSSISYLTSEPWPTN